MTSKKCQPKLIYQNNLVPMEFSMSTNQPPATSVRSLQAKVTWNSAKQICTPSRSSQFDGEICDQLVFYIKKTSQLGVDFKESSWPHVWYIFLEFVFNYMGNFCRSQCVNYLFFAWKCQSPNVRSFSSLPSLCKTL